MFNRKYDLSLVRKLQQEGKIPKFRIAETKDASGESTFRIEVCLIEDLYITPRHIFRASLSEEDCNSMYPKIEANTWVTLEKYSIYKEGIDVVVRTYVIKKGCTTHH